MVRGQLEQHKKTKQASGPIQPARLKLTGRIRLRTGTLRHRQIPPGVQSTLSRRLQFTFGVPAYSSDMSIVTIDIIPIDGGCELTLATELKGEWADRTKDGWGKILRTLQTAFDSLTKPQGEN